MAADEILDAAWAKEHAEVDRRVALAIAAHNKEDHARFRGLVTLGADFVAAPAAAALPRCSAFGGNTGIASGVITTVNLTGVAFDPDGWCDLAANTITVPNEGDYEIHAYVGWSPEGATDPTTGTYRVLYLDLTPGYDRSRQDPPPPAIDSGLSEFSQETILFEHLAAGTTISLKVSHDATGNMIVGAAAEGLYTARLTVVQLG
jgi:hypothetical protein